MPFREEINHIYNDVFYAVAEGLGYSAFRVDRIEHIEKIDDEIIVQINRSRFLIADLSFERCNVYYEAGYAKGLNKGVIFTCRNDFLEKIHFDIRQYNTIIWSENDLDGFKTKLALRIEAVFGRGGLHGP